MTVSRRVESNKIFKDNKKRGTLVLLQDITMAKKKNSELKTYKKGLEFKTIQGIEFSSLRYLDLAMSGDEIVGFYPPKKKKTKYDID